MKLVLPRVNVGGMSLLMALMIVGLLMLNVAFPQAIRSRPNIVIIVADDLGYNDLGSYGSTDIETPHLDQLAKEGVRLTNFYVTGSGCTPSRSGLLTGRYPQRNGTYELFRNDLVNYGHKYTAHEYSISPERVLGTDLREVFVSEALKPSGYVNGYFGKWDLGQLKRFLPLQQGFDAFYGFANTGIDYYAHERYGIPSMYNGNELTEKDKGTYSTHLFEREALKFINNQTDKPFFLYLSYNAPHMASSLEPGIKGTVQAPEDFIKRYQEGKTPAEFKRRGYKAAVTCMDESIGNILMLLKRRGYEDNTIVIFLSDNGGSPGVSSNAPLRGGKAQFFEGGIRVPCIVKWPGHIKKGSVNDALLSSLEIFPSVMAAANTPLPDSIIYDGFNMWPTLRGQENAGRTEIYWEFRGDYAARIDQWKWVASKKGRGLFDLSKDVSEKSDVTAQYPEIAARMESAFRKWQRDMANAEPRGPFKDF